MPSEKILEQKKAVVEELAEKLEEAGIRVEADIRNEKIGYKLREARNERVSYMCVIGEKEAEAGSVTVRSGKEGELGEMSVEDFADKLLAEILELDAELTVTLHVQTVDQLKAIKTIKLTKKYKKQ